MDSWASRLLKLWLTWAATTAVLYALPLTQNATDLVSNGSFVVGAVMLVGCALRAVRLSVGIDRIAWSSVALTLLITTVVFMLTPASTNGQLTPALLMAPAVALTVMGTIMLFGRHALTNLGLTRVLFDAAWLTAGLLAMMWHLVINPLPALVDSRLELVVLLCFPVIAVVAGVVTATLMPLSAGSARWSLAAFGGGTATLAVAGTMQIRLALAGNLVFGTWDDYLWTVGLGLMGVAALDPSMGRRLRAANPHVRTQQVITVVPVAAVLAGIALNGWANMPRALGVVMLILLAVRVIVLSAEIAGLNSQLQLQANRDELTGLLNRRAILARFAIAESSPSVLTVLYIDLDGFKLVNDQHGHAAGDYVLIEVSSRLRTVVRRDDSVARIGGDEFVIITESPDSIDLAERLSLAVAAPMFWNDQILEVGCSVGLASGRNRSTDDLLAHADAALYKAKAAGRNQVRIAASQP